MNTLTNEVTSGPAWSSPADGRLPVCQGAPITLFAARHLFGDLPDRDLLDLMRRSMVRSLRGRQQIYKDGDLSRTVIVVLDGFVKLSSTHAAGREVVLEILPPGACFGEVSMLNHSSRDTDATTLSPCRLLAIDGRQFMEVMERSPEGLRAMVRLISHRLQTTTQRMIDAVALPAQTRLVKVLMLIAELRRSSTKNGVGIELPISQTEIGGMTGLTRESTNKHLAILRDAGWISLSGRSVTLLDVRALSVLSDAHRPERVSDGFAARAGKRAGARSAQSPVNIAIL